MLSSEGKMKFSLRAKTVILITLLATLMGIVGITVSNRVLTQVIDNSYMDRARDVANTLAVVLDVDQAIALKAEVMAIYDATDEIVTSEDWGSPEFDAYIARYSAIEQSAVFKSLRSEIRRIQDINKVDCMYLVALDAVKESAIYLVDAAYDDICPPGCIDPVYEVNRDLLTDPTRGFPPYISNTEMYGNLVTAGAPIYDSANNVVCYAMVDISMDMIRAQQQLYTMTHIALYVLLTLLVCVASIWMVNRYIIHPIDLLSNAAAHYNASNLDNSALDDLPIKSHDEIQSLYTSLKRMTHDINGYIDNLVRTTQELTRTRIEADEMNVLAHRDALTGVGTKLAYDQQIEKLSAEMSEGNAQFGIVMVDVNSLKWLNDTFGHDQGNVAIKKTCALLCDVFAHSPVYRFGGDEFVVVIKGRDYDAINDRVKEFDRRARETWGGKPWEAVNAAVGYALYADEDSVEDVFRRADHMMYERKKAMKADRRNRFVR